MNVKTLAASLTALGIAGLANAQDYNGGGFAIPDNNGAGGATSIVVADPGLVGNGMIVGITFGPEHTWVGDLSAVITHNDGSTSVSADLFRRPDFRRRWLRQQQRHERHLPVQRLVRDRVLEHACRRRQRDRG